MNKIFFIFLIFLYGLSFSYEISEFPHVSRYDERLKNISDESFLSNALDDSDLDLVFSALKRVGELRLTNLKSKVIGLIGIANPQANISRSKLYANYRNIFYLGILVLGKIGSSENDAAYLAGFLRDTKKDVLGTVCILQALGELKGNKKALDFLQEYSLTVGYRTDSRVVRSLVDAIVAQGKKSSNTYLISLRGRVSQEDRVYVSDAIMKLKKMPD
ncbi:MAG: hypothetical protein ACP5QT_01785 [Brevinematia bacterium]